MRFVYNDGGREAAGYKGTTGDCVCRAIAIATGLDYQHVYELLNVAAQRERKSKRKRKRSHARTGIHKRTIRRVMEALDWEWVPTMGIGTGCQVHLTDGELPEYGNLVVSVSKHLTAVVDGVIHDVYDPQRATPITEDGIQRIAHRCVYGYWYKPED